MRDETYWKQVDFERHYWKHRFYTATEGCDVADEMMEVSGVGVKDRAEMRAKAHQSPCKIHTVASR